MSGQMSHTTETNDVVRKYKRRTLIFAGLVVGVQVIYITANVIVGPSYWVPYFRSPACLLLLLGCCIWELLGITLMYAFRFRSPVVFGLICLMFLVVFALPAIRVPFLFPYNIRELIPDDLTYKFY